jgi:tetratricopeptide (TPR) repeat protein
LAFFARAAELAGPGPTRRAALRARGELLLGLFRGREATVDLELAMREAAAEGAAAEEMEALLRLGRAYYVVALDYGPAIEHLLPALERARQLAIQLGDRRGEALALILTQRHAESFAPELWPQAAANAERALAIARELGDEDLEVDALRAASRSLSERLVGYRENIEQIAVSLERRGDLIALNEHLFDSMWTYWRLGRFADCVTCSDRATALAGRLGIPPVQYGTIKSFALVDLGRFDEAWQALEQEVADDDHPFGQAFQLLGQTWWYLASGDVERVLRDVPRVFADARELKRAWMIVWAENMLASAIVATHPDGTSAAALKAAVEAAGGRLTGDGLVAAQLLAGNADSALAECERSLPQLDAEGRGRPYWTIEELRVRALLALGRVTEVYQAVDAALAVVMPLGWQSLAWRLRASRAVALAGLGDKTAAAAERRAAADILMTVAGTLRDGAARARFLSRPAAASLLA